jgi:hypothetical protein
MKTAPTQAQERHDAIEVLRNQLRPFKAYEVTKPTAPSVNIIKNTINGREVWSGAALPGGWISMGFLSLGLAAMKLVFRFVV